MAALPIALWIGMLAPSALARSTLPQDSGGSDESWFSCSALQGSCTDMLVRAIRLADKTILVETGGLGPQSVEHALCSDMRRGVDVEIVQDSADCDSHPTDAGHQRPAIQCEANNKVGIPQTMVIDGQEVVRSFFGPRPSSTAPRPITHLSLTLDRVSAMAYSDTWEGQSRPLQTKTCRLSN